MSNLVNKQSIFLVFVVSAMIWLVIWMIFILIDIFRTMDNKDKLNVVWQYSISGAVNAIYLIFLGGLYYNTKTTESTELTEKLIKQT